MTSKPTTRSKQPTALLAVLFPLALVGATTLVCGASAAHADEGWYASGQAGGSFLSSADLVDPTAVLDTEFDPGFSTSGTLGYHWGKFRVEGEAAYAENGIDQVEILGINIDADGDMESLSFMANAFRDFDIGEPWNVYIGGGLGISLVSINFLSALGVPLADDDDTVFAYQLGAGVGAGVGYEITRATTLTLDYRFFLTTDPEFTEVDGTLFDAEYESHNVRVGIRYNF